MTPAFLLVPVILLLMKGKWDKYIFNPMITISCMAIAAFSGAHARTYVCIAYLFSVIGDFFLCHKKIHKDSYLFGIAGFFMAHLGYLIYALSNAAIGEASVAVASVLVIVYGAYLFIRLYPALDSVHMRIAVSMYMLISIAVFSCAFSMNLPIVNQIFFILGIFMILFSDTIISFSDFLGMRKWDKLIMPTYFLCHIFVCASLVL